MSATPKSEVVNVTPEMAGKWLDRHWKRIGDEQFRQRPISMTRVIRYAKAMEDGQWQLSPEGLAFDADDNLIQGQHRLEAVRRSGVTVPFFVSTGWPVGSTIKVLDQGVLRTNGALLALDGLPYANQYATVVQALVRVAYRGNSATLTYANCEYMLNKVGLKSNIDAIIAKSPNPHKDMTGPVVGPLAFYHTVRPTKATQFADALFNFETTKGSPVNLYLNWVKSGRWRASQGTGERSGGIKSATLRKLAGIIACIRAWDDNETITRIVPSSETIQWLADMNPKLRDWIRSHITPVWKEPTKVPGKR